MFAWFLLANAGAIVVVIVATAVSFQRPNQKLSSQSQEDQRTQIGSLKLGVVDPSLVDHNLLIDDLQSCPDYAGLPTQTGKYCHHNHQSCCYSFDGCFDCCYNPFAQTESLLGIHRDLGRVHVRNPVVAVPREFNSTHFEASQHR